MDFGFDYSYTVSDGITVRASHVNDLRAAVDASFENAEIAFDKTLSFNIPIEPLALGAEYGNSLIGFDANENLVIYGLTYLDDAVNEAAAQVDLAAAQAGIAATQAGISTNSASNSGGQAVIATTKAGIATTQAGIATTQAGIATTQAGIATTKAGEALASANSAAGSVAAALAGKSNIGHTHLINDIVGGRSFGRNAQAQSFSASVATRVNFSAGGYDDLGGMNGAGQFVVQATGEYIFTATLHGSTGNTSNRILDLLINGVVVRRLAESGQNSNSKSFGGSSGPLQCTLGQVIDVYYMTDIADSTNTYFALTYFTGQRIK